MNKNNFIVAAIVWLLCSCESPCTDLLPRKGYIINLNAFQSVVQFKEDRTHREYKVTTKCGKKYFLILDNEGKLQEIKYYP